LNIRDIISGHLHSGRMHPPGQPNPTERFINVRETIDKALADAGLDARNDPTSRIRSTIDDALTAAGLTARAVPARSDDALDGVAYEVVQEVVDGNAASPPTAEAGETMRPAAFVSRTFSNAAGTLAYKLYVPSARAAGFANAMPIVVMLHGCTQSPDDFAAGTRMNELAERHGFLVVYPAQAAGANAMKCWNWFRADNQARDAGEPALIAGIVREVAALHAVDERRIFVAGMSAGGAMATVLAATYPELFAAAGCHSGLGYRAAHDMPSAMGAMGAHQRTAALSMQRPGPASTHRLPVPIIVFHGDQDHTVNPRNGEEVIRQALAGHDGDADSVAALRETISVAGREATRTTYSAAGVTIAEHWNLHGVGHAWSGGSAAGSYTDTGGPSASEEMLRFFRAHPRVNRSVGDA